MTNGAGTGCLLQLIMGLLAAILIFNHQSADQSRYDMTASSIRATNSWIETQIYATETAKSKPITQPTITPTP